MEMKGAAEGRLNLMLAEYRALTEEKRQWETATVQAVGLLVTGTLAALAAAGVAKSLVPISIAPTILGIGMLFVASIHRNIKRMAVYIACLEADMLKVTAAPTRVIGWESLTWPIGWPVEKKRVLPRGDPARLLEAAAAVVFSVFLLIGSLGAVEALKGLPSLSPEAALAAYVALHVLVAVAALYVWLGMPADLDNRRKAYVAWREQSPP